MKSQFDKLLVEKENYSPVDFSKQAHRIGNKLWRVENLVELAKELPVKSIPITDIRAIKLNLPLIKHQATHMDLAYHMRVAMNANLEYPVILGQDGRIMDGHHRVIKTIAYGLPTILVVQFKIDPQPDTIIDNTEHVAEEDFNPWLYNEGCLEGV